MACGASGEANPLRVPPRLGGGPTDGTQIVGRYILHWRGHAHRGAERRMRPGRGRRGRRRGRRGAIAQHGFSAGLPARPPWQRLGAPRLQCGAPNHKSTLMGDAPSASLEGLRGAWSALGGPWKKPWKVLERTAGGAAAGAAALARSLNTGAFVDRCLSTFLGARPRTGEKCGGNFSRNVGVKPSIAPGRVRVVGGSKFPAEAGARLPVGLDLKFRLSSSLINILAGLYISDRSNSSFPGQHLAPTR